MDFFLIICVKSYLSKSWIPVVYYAKSNTVKKYYTNSILIRFQPPLSNRISSLVVWHTVYINKGQKYLFQNNPVPTWVSNYIIIETDEGTMLSSVLIDVVSSTPDVRIL